MVRSEEIQHTITGTNSGSLSQVCFFEFELSPYEMYNAAVSLVRAVDTLDPDRAQQAARSSEVPIRADGAALVSSRTDQHFEGLHADRIVQPRTRSHGEQCRSWQCSDYS